METEKVEIELGELTGAYCIVGHPTGVEYGLQCGGLGCLYNRQEGFLLPLEDSASLVQWLDYHFAGGKYVGHCYSGIDQDDADYIETQLRSSGIEWLVVDRERLENSVEAWIYMKLAPDYPCVPFCYHSDPATNIVLIWENSD